MTQDLLDIPVLDADALAVVTERQKAQQAEWRAADAAGRQVDIGDTSILVLPRVFAPGDDTRFMVRNMVVPPQARVLDVGTGSGVLAAVACVRGAARCVALDINPDAVENAKRNRDALGFRDRMDVRVSDGLDALAADETFDLVLANLPGRSGDPADGTARAQWDAGFRTNRSFFENVPQHLAPDARILMTKANYPELRDLLAYTIQLGYAVDIVDRMEMPDDDPRVYYLLAFSGPLGSA